MINLTATTAKDLQDQLGEIDITVSPRDAGRTSEQCERRSICRLLASYAETDLLAFPMEIEKRERPDFLLHFPSSKIGIEITEAVPRDWAWANARRQKITDNNLVFLQRFTPGEPYRSREEVDKMASGTVMGDGWSGDTVETEWAEAMLHFALHKAESLNKPGYARFDSDWLLIYDGWPLPAVDYPKAAEYFKHRLRALARPLPFDRLFVECSQTFWQFRDSAHESIEIRDLWSSINA